MRSVLCFCISATMATSVIAMSSPAKGASLGFNFEHRGFPQGAVLEGMFEGEDEDRNGRLDLFELSAFKGSFSGTTLDVGFFELDLPDLASFDFDLSGSAELWPLLWAGGDDTGLFVHRGTYSGGAGAELGYIENISLDRDLRVPLSSTLPLRVTQKSAVTSVPEPTTLLGSLIALGFGGTLLNRRKKTLTASKAS